MDQERRVKRTRKVAQQATAVFADAEIIAVRSTDDGLIYASLPHLCRALGLDVASQEERIEEHAVLTEGICEDMEGTDQPKEANTREQSRFPLALKKARLAKQLKQETLAAQLHVKLRTLVSWETGTRIPPIGIVILLSLLLTDSLELSNDLLFTYIADDLTRQARIQDDDNFRALALRTLEQVSQLQTRGHEQEQERELHLSLFRNQSREDRQEHLLDHQGTWQQEPQHEGTAGDPLQQLFAVLETLRTRTELIPVVQDFLREVAPHVSES